MKLLRFIERTGISYREALDMPAEFIEHAFVIWSLDAHNAKVKAASVSSIQ